MMRLFAMSRIFSSVSVSKPCKRKAIRRGWNHSFHADQCQPEKG